MPTSLSPLDVANSALSKIGSAPIASLLDNTNQSAILANNNFGLAYLEVSRAARWSCLLSPAVLTQVAQTPLPGCPTPPSATPWAPLTAYLANVYLTYGGYYYLVMFNYTSSNNFMTDLTTGALQQTNLPTTNPFFPGCCDGGEYPSGWAFQYALPADFVLMASLNANICEWGGNGGTDGDDYEIMGTSLYCDSSQAVIQYVQNVADTTRFDPLMMNCITIKLASMIATPLRQDGGKAEAELLQAYRIAIREARQKNGGEKKARRFNPIRSSKFNQARFGGVNG